MERLGPGFFEGPTLLLAERLLGKVFVLSAGPGRTELRGRIVETEAYVGSGDDACHARGGLRPGNRPMFAAPGTLYVPLSYGCHYLANIVSEPEGIGGSVLLRAMEPLEGLDDMQLRRGTANPLELLNGPGKLTRAFGIDRTFSGKTLFGSLCWIEDAPEIPASAIGTSARIGITKSAGLPWRKFIAGSPYVSKSRSVNSRKKMPAGLEC